MSRRSAGFAAAAVAACSVFVLAVPKSGCSCAPHSFPPSATVLPSVTGTAQVGQTLTCNSGSWIQNGAGFALTRQWQSSTDSGASWSNLSATGSTYIPVGGDQGNDLRCQQTGTNVTGATTVASALTGPVSAGSFLANVWVTKAGGSCARSGSAVALNSATSCGTFQSAYNLAQSGDTVRVACDNYSTLGSSFMKLSYTASKDALASNIVFDSADNTRGCATLPGVTFLIQSGHVEFHHFTMSQATCVNSSTASVPPCPQITIQSSTTNATTGAHDVVIDDFQSSELSISGAVYNVTVESSDFGPMWDQHGLLGCNGSVQPCTAVPHDILIQDVALHDFFNTTACQNGIPTGCLSAHHEGCALTNNAGYNIVYNRDQFYNCEDLPFYIHPFLGEVHDLTLENSRVGGLQAPVAGTWTNGAITQGCNTVGNCPPQFQNDFNTSSTNRGAWNIKLISNTWASVLKLLPSNVPDVCGGQGGSGGCEWRGNIGSPACSGNSGFSTGWTVQYNAALGTYCGSGTLLGTATGTATACGGSAVCDNNYKTSSYGLAADGYHLAGGSLLTHILPSGLSWLPATDIDGDTRSANSSPGDDDG